MTATSQEINAVFSGRSACTPAAIRDALGWLEPTDEEAIPHLIGALMSLCRTVEEQTAEIARLRAGVAP